jgi:hypothetical protein
MLLFIRRTRARHRLIPFSTKRLVEMAKIEWRILGLIQNPRRHGLFVWVTNSGKHPET